MTTTRESMQRHLELVWQVRSSFVGREPHQGVTLDGIEACRHEHQLRVEGRDDRTQDEIESEQILHVSMTALPAHTALTVSIKVVCFGHR